MQTRTWLILLVVVILGAGALVYAWRALAARSARATRILEESGRAGVVDLGPKSAW